MATADNKENTSGTQGAESKPDPVSERLKGMEASFENLTQELVKLNATRQASQEPARQEIDDDDVFDPKALRDKIMREVTETTQQQMRDEQRKSNVIYNLSQEYPEIHSDKSLQKQVIEAQRNLPKSLQDTAEGYEMAVLKAVANAGVLPKSRRPDTSEAEISVSGTSQRTERTRKSTKAGLSEETIEFARLMGRDVDNPKVREALEKAANRDTYTRYR